MGDWKVANPSPRFKARLAGIFEALEGLTSAFGQLVVLGKIIVFGSAAVTAANILAHQRLLWFGFASSVAGGAFHAIWIFLFYDLFKIVNRASLYLQYLSGLLCAQCRLLPPFFTLPLGLCCKKEFLGVDLRRNK